MSLEEALARNTEALIRLAESLEDKVVPPFAKSKSEAASSMHIKQERVAPVETLQVVEDLIVEVVEQVPDVPEAPQAPKERKPRGPNKSKSGKFTIETAAEFVARGAAPADKAPQDNAFDEIVKIITSMVEQERQSEVVETLALFGAKRASEIKAEQHNAALVKFGEVLTNGAKSNANFV